MLLKNTTLYPSFDVNNIVHCAADGIPLHDVIVWIRPALYQLEHKPKVLSRGKQAKYLVVANVSPGSLAIQTRLFENHLLCHNWKEFLLFRLAHQFKHLTQMRKYKHNHRIELMADNAALRQLSNYRVINRFADLED